MNSAIYKFSKINRSGFSLIEALTALVIVGFVCGTVLVVINDSVDAIADHSIRLNAVEVARENMESLLSQTTLKESAETGISEIYPDIEWSKSVEVTSFPGESKQWMKAVSTANFYNSDNELEEINFENWLAPLTDQQEKQVLKDRQAEQDYLNGTQTPDEPVEEEKTPPTEDKKSDIPPSDATGGLPAAGKTGGAK